MPQVQALATLHRSADSMWRELGSLQDIARWPMVAAVHGGQEPGATWTIERHAPASARSCGSWRWTTSTMSTVMR